MSGDLVKKKLRRDAFAKARAKMKELRETVVRECADSQPWDTGMVAIRDTSIDALDTFAQLIDDLERIDR